MDFLSTLATALRDADPLLLFVVFAIAALVVVGRVAVEALRVLARRQRNKDDTL